LPDAAPSSAVTGPGSHDRPDLSVRHGRIPSSSRFWNPFEFSDSAYSSLGAGAGRLARRSAYGGAVLRARQLGISFGTSERPARPVGDSRSLGAIDLHGRSRSASLACSLSTVKRRRFGLSRDRFRVDAGRALLFDANRQANPMISGAELLSHTPEEPTPVAAPGPPGQHVRIARSGRWPRIELAELWSYRGLFFFLVLRDIKVRYAQTVLGASWAVLNPVLTMVVFTVIFGRFARIPSDGVPYPVFSLAAVVPWTYFASSLGGASNSLLSNTNLITKVYFPRLVIPFAPVLAALLDFAIGFTILLVVMLGFGVTPRAEAIILIPLLVSIAAMAAAGVGCWLAALNIQYRDARFLTGFLLQIWMYGSPVVYPASLIPEAYRPFFVLNPMMGVITGFRAVLLGTTSIPWSAVATSLVTASAMLVSGALYFRHTERIFADVA
jgi:lipopolysaccharide transport system permease protein